MLLIRAIVRPEKSTVVLKALFEAGFPAVTKLPVFGRGKQRGLKVGNVTYDELPKELLLIAIKDADKDFVINTIIDAARSGSGGAFGDGKIFVTPIIETYTISNGIKEA
jgi:nitrogen regulatory protein PII 1